MDELVSVIVPVYNVEAYLPHCLESLAAQTYRNLEIILVDDGSTDSSGELCDEFAAKDKRAKVIHQVNKGTWAARNAGQDAATGAYLWIPDGDDYFHRDMVRLMHEAINRVDESTNQKYQLAIVRYKMVDGFEEDTVGEVEVSSVVMRNKDLYENWVLRKPIGWMSFMWNKLYRRDLIQDIRTGDYKYAQDREFNIKVCRKRVNAIYIDNDLYFWMQRPSSAMHSDNYILERSRCEAEYAYENMSKDDTAHRQYYLTSLYVSLVITQFKMCEMGKKKEEFQKYKVMVNKTWRAFLCTPNSLISEKKLWAYFLRSRFPKAYYRASKAFKTVNG